MPSTLKIVIWNTDSKTSFLVKADPDSETMHRLDKAGQAVKRASEDLTKAAKDAREAKDEAQVNFLFFPHREKEILFLSTRVPKSHHHLSG